MRLKGYREIRILLLKIEISQLLRGLVFHPRADMLFLSPSSFYPQAIFTYTAHRAIFLLPKSTSFHRPKVCHTRFIKLDSIAHSPPLLVAFHFLPTPILTECAGLFHTNSPRFHRENHEYFEGHMGLLSLFTERKCVL